MREWQLQEAKAHFSDVIRTVISEGPQTVTLHGKPTVVVLSIEEYQRLTQPEENFVEFMQNSPLKGVDLDLERLLSNTNTREIDL